MKKIFAFLILLPFLAYGATNPPLYKFSAPLVLTDGTVSIPPASGTADGYVNQSAQTFAGAKTFLGAVGSNVSLKAPFFASPVSGVATAGQYRMVNGQAVAWMNHAGNGNLLLTTDSSDNLTYNGTIVGYAGGVVPVANGGTGLSSYTTGDMIYASGATTLSKLAIGAGNTVQVSTGSAPSWALLTNSNLSNSAAVAYSKLALTGHIVNADVNSSAGIVYSKLSLADSILNADINSAAAIAYSKLNLTGGILNADINASAAIAYSKLALTGHIVNADVNASAAIAYSKLALTNSILNADINASAAIAYSKLNLASSIKASDMNSQAAAVGAVPISNGIGGVAYGLFTIGTINSQTKSANGLVVNQSSIVAQSADASFPGLVTTGAQVMAGAKTFSTSVTSPLFQSTTGSPATAGQIRFANADTFQWRNYAGTGNLAMGVTSGNQLIFNGLPLGFGPFDPDLVLVSDGAGIPTASTTSTTQVQYLHQATGTTGTPTTNLVFSTSPTFLGTVALPAITIASTSTFSALTATTVPYLDASKQLASSAVTPTQLGYLGIASGTTGTGSLVYSASPNLTGALTVGSTINVVISSASGGGSTTYNHAASSGEYNFRVDNGVGTTQTYSVTPSTAVDGSTFTNALLKLAGGGGVTLGNAALSSVTSVLGGVASTTSANGTLVVTGGLGVSGAGNFGGAVGIGGATTLSALTATTVPYLDASKILTSSLTTPTELGFVHNVTSAIQTQLDAKASSSLTSAHIFVGNGSNIATDVAVTGDVAITNAGVTSISNATVTGKLLTGYSSGAGTVSATDSILQAIQKLNGNDALKLTIANNLSDVNNSTTAFNNISGMSAVGDLIYGGTSGTRTRLAGPTAANSYVLTQTGTGAAGAAPIWLQYVSTNTASTIPVRDSSGNFAAGTITASITGHSSLDLAAASNLSDVGTPATAYNNISGMTTLGDLVTGGASGARTRLAGNTTTTPMYLRSTGAAGVATAQAWAQVAFSDLSGSATGAQLPNPSSSSLGGVQSIAAVSHQFLTTISTSGVPSLAQPAFTDISGSVASTQMPALTGDVTTSAGAVATTVAKIQSVTVSGTTGTGNVMFSAGPTSTGTFNGAIGAFSGQLSSLGNLGVGTASPNFSGNSGGYLTVVGSAFGSVELGVTTLAGAGGNVGSLTFYNTSSNKPAQLFVEAGPSGNAYGTLYIKTLKNSVLTTGITISEAQAVTLAGAFLAPNLATSSAATTGTLCWTTGSGNVNVDTTVACLSSTRKVKQDIVPLDAGLDTVMKLRPVSYQRKAEFNPQHNGREVGFIAEDVQQVDDRLVAADANGEVFGVRYMQYTALLTKAIQEQQAQIEKLRAEIEELK